MIKAMNSYVIKRKSVRTETTEIVEADEYRAKQAGGTKTFVFKVDGEVVQEYLASVVISISLEQNK